MSRNQNAIPTQALILLAITIPIVAISARGPVRTPPPRQTALRNRARKDQHPAIPQLLEGGLWRTDGNYQSVLMLKNVLETSGIAVTPVLYMADGYEYDLPPVQLDPAGVAMVDITSAVEDAPAEVGSHISTYGSAGIKTKWPWQAVFAEVRNTDDIQGLLYQSHLDADADALENPATPLTPQTIESTWWKQDPHVSGFLALTSHSLAAITASVRLGDNLNQASVSRSYVIEPHATTWVDFAPLWAALPASADAGPIEITYTGAMHAVSPTGGMEDADKGYSHMLHFQIPEALVFSAQLARLPAHLPVSLPRPSLPNGPTTFDSTGLMIGPQDADMQFPAGTNFMPYLVLRNTTAKPLVVRLAANAMAAGAGAMDVPLGTLQLAALEARRVDMAALLQASSLRGFHGYMNLRTSFTGLPTDLLQESGSIDPSLNYVFEVPPKLERAIGPGMLNYWNANGDTDTMVTVYNYGDAPQDVLVTLEHREGKYEMPIHLAPHASMMFSIGQLIRTGAPDRNGTILPANIVQGSLRFSGLSGSHKDRLTIGIAAGIFNARLGTCCYPCLACDGGEYAEIDPDPLILGINLQTGLTNQVMFSDGSLEDFTSATDFTSDDPGTAYQYDNQTTGEVLGEASIAAYVDVVSPDGCTCTGIQGCGDVELDDSTDVTVAPVITCGGNGTGCTPADIWWFNGEAPSGYTLSEAFGLNQGSGSGTIAWSDSLTGSGANSELSLSGTTSPTLTATSSGYTTAGSRGGTCINLTVNGISASNNPVCFNVRAPVDVTLTDEGSCGPYGGGYSGYTCTNFWTIEDQFGAAVPSGLNATESWATGASYPTSPYSVPCTPGTGCTSGQQAIANDVPGGYFASETAIEDLNGYYGSLVPTPGNLSAASDCTASNSGSEIVNWEQQFHVGSKTAGQGVLVQVFNDSHGGPATNYDKLHYFLNCELSRTQ